MSIRAAQQSLDASMCLALAMASMLLTTCGTAVADGQEIDLTGASAINTRGDWGYHISVRTPPEDIIDGDPETVWNSGSLSFSLVPENLFIVLPEPVAVGRFELLGTEGRALTGFEVYARVDDGWALLGQAQGGDQALVELDLLPTNVEMLRVRIGRQPRRNTYAHIRTVRLFAPPADAELVTLSPEEVAGETGNERVFIREALGLREPEPRVTYDPEIGYLGYVTSFLDTMIEKGTDRYGEVHSSMFAGILEIDTHEHPGGYIPSLPGQRWWDRPIYGGNLAHDVPLLEAMEHVSDLTRDEKYRDAARAYLQFFIDNCTGTPTGLWPWGEHVYWDFYRERYSDHYPWDMDPHELEGRAPMTFWEMAWEMNPEAVLGQATGLLNHVFDLETFAFSRHGDISKVLPDPRPADLRGLDFPGAGAGFMRIWAFAWSKSGDAHYYELVERMTDYFEDVRLEKSGMLPVLSQYAWRPALRPSRGGTLSVGLSMLESAELLEGTALGERLQQLGSEYVQLAADAEPVAAATPPEVIDRPAASGEKAVSFWESHGAWLDLHFDLPQAGEYLMTVRYGLSVYDTRRVVLVNGEEVGEMELPGTGGWSNFETVTLPLVPLNLPAGEVVVRLLNRDSAGLCLDWVALHGADGTPHVLAEAQDAAAMGVVEVPPAPVVVGFDTGYGGASVLTRQIPDRRVTPFVGTSTQMLAYRMTGAERHLEAAREVAEAYAAIKEVPEYDHLRASVFGSLIHMMLDMHEFDQDERWLQAAERFARAGIESLYGNGLFRGATNQWIYDSHLGVSTFVEALVRLHSVTHQ